MYSLEEQKENRKRWIAALRSGEYPQGCGFLRHYNPTVGELFCCMGVLADLADVGKWRAKRSTFGYHPYLTEDSSLQGHLDARLMDWVGLRTGLGKFTDEEGEACYLTELNDRGVPFPKIADIIEAEPEGLFVEYPAV